MDTLLLLLIISNSVVVGGVFSLRFEKATQHTHSLTKDTTTIMTTR